VFGKTFDSSNHHSELHGIFVLARTFLGPNCRHAQLAVAAMRGVNEQLRLLD
jgi:hypothetical protein